MRKLFLLIAVAVLPVVVTADPESHRAERDDMRERGLWRELIDQYHEKLLPVSDERSGADLDQAVRAIRELGAWAEFDPLVELAVARHPENPHILRAAANAYQNAPKSGRLIAGEFERRQRHWRHHRGGPDADPQANAGETVDTSYRDRVRTLQLLRAAIDHAAEDREKSAIWRQFGQILLSNDAWKLQTLTPLDELPEWGEPGPSGGTEGAPWDGDAPVLHEIPESWDAAATDGERWRFALAEQARLVPRNASRITREYADFTRSQFGVDTLAQFGWWRQPDADAAEGILEIHTLAENECLARTSDGIRRFTLPDEHHFIALYRSVLEANSRAGDALVQVFLNRNQREKAREALEQTIAAHGPGHRDARKNLLAQITGNWGRFDAAEQVPAGENPQIPLVFRNANSISLTASPVDIQALLADMIEYIRENPETLDGSSVRPQRIASRLIDEYPSKYIRDPAATWRADLTPLSRHRDTRADLEAPIDKPGAWWIKGTLGDGNEIHTMAWILDTILVQRPVGGQLQWWLADAANGAPIPGADIEFFGYRQLLLDREDRHERRMEIRTSTLQRTTGEDGKTLLNPGDWEPQYRWLAIARAADRAPAFFGFSNLSVPSQPGDPLARNVTYAISDRPLYKPGDTVHTKFFLREVGYDNPDHARWANQSGTLTIRDGRGEEVMKFQNLRTDALGAIEQEFILPGDAALGNWHANFSIRNHINARLNFRVEEFRTPEYEVTVEAPDEPISLGDTFTATVRADYFHGAPVRNAEVEITVKRGSVREPWFPTWRWDWLYGRGAWWNNPEASWHPTWHVWGCIPPPPPWRSGQRWTPDEIVIQTTAPIGEDGTAEVEIDTRTAKEIHGDMDARYTIEARVTDASRREETGTGTVIAARQPFEVVVWTDRGHARTGDALEATLAAATLAGKPVADATGTLRLLRLTLDDDGRVVENETQSWAVTTGADGRVTQRFTAPATGQYRLAATLEHNDGEPVEAASILNIHSKGRHDPDDWNFGPLELVADQLEYQPGDTLKLRVNSDQPDAHVWLFLHITRNQGREAKRIALDGKSTEIEVPLTLADMPNMFIEGITVHGAQVHTAVQQVLLPPVSKLIDVTLEPAASRVGPGETSSLIITLRDAEGNPVTGTTTLTIYDKALEAITGGSNVPAIHESFWNWRNHYHSRSLSHSIPHPVGNLQRRNVPTMSSLGRFPAAIDKSGPIRPSSSPMRMRQQGGAAMEMDNDRMLMADAAPAAMMMERAEAGEFGTGFGDTDGPDITVRKDFADLLKWAGTIETDENGRAEITLEFPDNLTTWKARVWHLGRDSSVGEGTTEIITSKELLVRLQAPRFLVERDEATLTAVVHNDHDTAKTVTISLDLDGGIEAIDGSAQTLEIPARSDARVDWRVRATTEGEATIRMTANAGDDGDAVERTLPIHVHGMARQDAWSVTLDPEESSAKIEIEVPAQRRVEQSTLTIRYSPTVAGAVVDAIPYLATDPEGSTFETLNRFVPAVIAQQMLRETGVNLTEIRHKRTNLNPQQLGHPADRAGQWRQWQTNPVFDEIALEKMVATGIDRLRAMQNSDGGWGWFSGYRENSWPHTTVTVVHGLLTARANGADIPEDMIDAGLAWLQIYERQQTDALQLYVERQALRQEGKSVPRDGRRTKQHASDTDAFIRMVLGSAARDSEPMLAFLHRDRLRLSVYGKSLLGLEHHRKKDTARRDEVLRVIAQFLKHDPENQTAFLELPNRETWWFWHGNEIETHAWYLKFLTAVQPAHADTRGIAKYLVNNRRNATWWRSNRDTAYAVAALAGFFKASGESDPDLEVEVLINGESKRKVTITRDNLFTFDGTLTLTGKDVPTGTHTIELRKTGDGPLYANAYLEVFTLEDRFRPAGLEIKVERRVSRLVELAADVEVPDATGLITTQTGQRFRREPLEDGAAIASGDRIEVELILESKNHYEYLVFSDAKAAGFEALDALSGYIPGARGGFSTYMEPRDRTVDFFIRSLPRGTHTLRYQLRAEAPGIYKAMPAEASALYAPELRANSDDIILTIE